MFSPIVSALYHLLRIERNTSANFTSRPSFATCALVYCNSIYTGKILTIFTSTYPTSTINIHCSKQAALDQLCLPSSSQAHPHSGGHRPPIRSPKTRSSWSMTRMPDSLRYVLPSILSHAQVLFSNVVAAIETECSSVLVLRTSKVHRRLSIGLLSS